MRLRLLLLVLAIGLALAPGVFDDAGAQRGRPPVPRPPVPDAESGDATPTPSDQAAAAAAGLQAGAPSGTARASAGVPTVSVARVFATQYNPNTPGSVEVAVPDKCAKFAALRNTTALSSHGCPAGYVLGLDYRVLVIRDTGQAKVLPVKDVGPWNVDDNYWDFGAGAPRPRRMFQSLATGLPEAQAAFYNNFNFSPNCKNLDGTLSGRGDGADQFGRCVLNPAGIDLSVAAAAQLGLPALHNEWVTVAFLWAPIRTTITSSASGLNVDVYRASKTSGTPVIQWTRHSGLNQQWRFEQITADAYRIVSVNSGMVLDVRGRSVDSGAEIIQWPWHGGANQLWRMEPVGEGEFRIVSVHSGKVIDVKGGAVNAGAPLIQWPWHGGANQRWRLSAIGTG